MNCPKCITTKSVMRSIIERTPEGSCPVMVCLICSERIYIKDMPTTMNKDRREKAQLTGHEEAMRPCSVIGCENNARIKGGTFDKCNVCLISIESYWKSTKFRSVRRVRLNCLGEWEINNG